jgi:hypothetical protein
MKMEELLNSLSPEMQEKAKACKSAEELAAFFAENGIPLSDEALDAAAGGGLIEFPRPKTS